VSYIEHNMKKKVVKGDKKVDLTRKELEDIQGIVSDASGVDTVSVHITRTNKVSLPPYVSLFQDFARIACVEFDGTTAKVLMFLMSIQGYENVITVDIKTMSEVMGKSESTIKRCMKILYGYNVVKKFNNVTDRRRNDYFVNPLATWKGKSYKRLKQIKEIQQMHYQLDLFDGQIVDDNDLNKSKKGKRLLLPPKE